MRSTLLKSIAGTLAVGAFLWLMPVPSNAQEPPPGRGGGGRGGRGGGGRAPLPPAGPFTRLADGHPNMSGYWNAANNGGAVFEVQKHPVARPGVAAGNGAVVDPPDGLIPYTPEYAQMAKENFEKHLADEPELHCYESGVPSQLYRQFGFQILQPAGYMVMNWEFMHAYRIIPTDNRPHVLPASTKLFMGDSVGHWDGDTLVVDTTNNSARPWFDTVGNIHSDQFHVVERFTPKDERTIDYEATMDDSKAYTRPWTIKFQLTRMMGQPDFEIMEFACIEGNRDAPHYIEAAGGKAQAKPPAKH